MAIQHPARKAFQRTPKRGGAGFNAYAAGKKHYGTGRLAPNVGKTAAAGKVGYAERDAKAEARKKALMRRVGSK